MGIQRLQRLRLVIVSGLVLASGCQERLAAPATCPDLCPGEYEIRDTIITPVGDSGFEGYIQAGQGTSLRVSYNFAPGEDRVVLRFIPRPDSFVVNADSALPYTIDSVSLAVSVVYRDTAVPGLYLYLYRLPATLDSAFAFTDAEAAFTPANIVDSLPVDDTLTTQRLVTILTGAALDRILIPVADSGVLALGVQIRAAQGTGIRFGNLGSAAPSFITHVTVADGDTVPNHQRFTRGPSFARFVSQSIPPLDPSLLTVGGVPSSRSLIRFPWPDFLRDSAQLIRVSLELVPSGPIPGLRGDTAFLQARPLLSDFGSKSPTTSDGFYVAVQPLVPARTDTVRLEVLRAATLWQGEEPRPPAFMLQLFPEAASFTRATFGSTRTAGLSPRLRVTYAARFPFEGP